MQTLPTSVGVTTQPKSTMKNSLIIQVWKSALTLGLGLPLQGGAAQFVELKADIESVAWFRGTENRPPTVHPKTLPTRCVVGTNSWLIEIEFDTQRNTWWFTGTNLIEWSVVTHETPEETKALFRKAAQQGTSMLGLAPNFPPVGARFNRTSESADGNPGRLPRISDLLHMPARIAWLAFCSGPALKRDGRRIFPPGDLWKEYITAPSGFADKTDVFEDNLGLPKTVDLYTTTRQPVLQYRVATSTNVLGWDFPLEFYLAQYRPVDTNGWQLDLTAKGKVTVIGPGTQPQIPPEAAKVLEK